MSKEFYDKYGKLVDCFSCNCIEPCSKSDSPLCSEGYVFFAKDKIADLEAKLTDMTEKYNACQEARKLEIEFNKQDKAELKQQLAEKELDAIRWKEHFNNAKMDCECLKEEIEKKDDEMLKGDCAFVKEVYNSEQEINELKKKLAEKEKEIENIKLCRCVNCKNEYEFMLEGLVEDLEKQIDKDDQDKISFAVEQLEKVKGSVQAFDGIELIGFIDNQIKAIKGEK